MKRRLSLLILAVFISGAIARPASAAATRTLKGHVLPIVEKSALIGRTPAAEPVNVSLVIQPDLELMKQTYESIYRGSPRGRKHFLSAREFAEKFDLAGKRRRLTQFALANGLSVNTAGENPDSMVVRLSGSAGVVEKAFGVQFNQYRATDGRAFRANANDPQIPAALVQDVAAVMGLSNLTRVARPHLRIGRKIAGQGAGAAAPAIAPRFSGTGPTSTISPSDIKTVYGLNSVALTGTGQTVALFELDGYNPTDIAFYAANFGLTQIPLTFVGVDGTINDCGGVSCTIQDPLVDTDMIEVALDIEMINALAPGAASLRVYDGPNTYLGVIHQYDLIATENLASVVSTSWGAWELANSASLAAAEEPIFLRMAIQGMSFFAASGDFGAFDNQSTASVDDPASQLYVTGVGGTTLAGNPSSYTEVAWDGSGGGVSSLHAIPSYQSGIAGTASQTNRNVPDVALNADPAAGYAVYVGGGWLPIGGTSAAAPLWAGFTVLVNQQREVSSMGALGFANPALYDVARSTSYTTSFHDITSGDNQLYVASTGYDNATGLGVFRGAAMLGLLENAVSHFGSPELDNVYAFPNPWDVRQGVQKRVMLANVPDGAKAKIFTVSGFLVKQLPITNGVAIWDLTNESGNDVASGLYLYLVTTDDNKAVGKIAVIK